MRTDSLRHPRRGRSNGPRTLGEAAGASSTDATIEADAGADTCDTTGRTRRCTSATAPKASAVSCALTILSRRAVSTQELRTRLAQRGYEAAGIDVAVAAMVDYGYLNDAALAQCVTARAQREGRGARWVQRTLQQRGIEATLGVAVDGDDAALRATELLQRRFKGALSGGGDPKTTARALRFLCNRGFSPQTAWRIVTAARAAHVDGPPQEG